MAEGKHNRIRWRYTDDAGNAWAVSADKYITDQVDGSSNPLVGGVADATSIYPSRPGSWKPRRVVCHSNSSSHSRTITLYDDTAPLKTKGTTILLNVRQSDGSDNEETFVSTGRVLPEGTGKSATYLHA